MSDPTVTRPQEQAQAATAFITTVGADHLVRLPDSIPAGATVAVVVVETSPGDAKAQADSAEARARRKEAGLELIEAFKTFREQPGFQPLTDEEIAAEVDAYRAEEAARRTAG